jgi:hypothetical protein
MPSYYPFRVKAILEVIAEEDVTPRQDVFGDAEDTVALERAINHKRRFQFSSAGVSVGSVLNFVKDESITCIVDSDSSVTYEGVSMSLSGAGLKAVRKLGYNWATVNGSEYWLYNGETLNSLRANREED